MNLNSIFRFFAKSKDDHVETLESKATLNDDSPVSDAKALVAIGLAKAKAGNYIAAIKDFDDAIEIDATSPEAYFERCKAKRALNDDQGANQDLDKAQLLLNRLDEGLKAYDAAKTAYYDTSDYKTAVKLYNRAITLIPSLTEIYYHRGCAKQYLEDYAGAMEDYSKSIEVDASNKSDAYHQRGKIKRNKLDDTDGALQDFNKAVELSPLDADILYSRATVLDEYDALQDLNRAVELKPSDAKLYFARALKRHKMEDVNGAIEDLTHVIEMEPSDADLTIADAYSLRASLKVIGLNDHESALLDYNKAVELDSSNPRRYVDRGMSRHTLKDLEGAIRDFNQAVALDASEMEAYYWRGLAKKDLGLEAESDADVNKAILLGYKE